MIHFIITGLLSLLISINCYGKEEIVIRKPDFLYVQTGGYSGFLTLGVEYQVTRWYKTGISLGYVPEQIGGRDLWSLSFKNAVDLQTIIIDHLAIVKFYGGINLLYSFDDRSYVVLPKKYPRRYYPSTALRLSPYAGAEYIKEDYGVYFEVSSLDHYLETYIRSSGSLNYKEIINYALGYKLIL